MSEALPALITHIYFTARFNSDPRRVKAGGLAQVLSYTPGWSRHGIRFHVVMPCADGQEPGVEEVNGVQWHSFKRGAVISASAPPHDESMSAAVQIIEKSSRSETETHLLMPCDDSTPNGPLILRDAARRGIASVMPVHMFPYPPNPWSLRDRVRVWRDRRWLRSITAIHANSEVSARAMREIAAMPPTWTKVIVNGVNTQRFHPAASVDEKLTLRRQLGLPEDKLIVLFVGGATARKGVDFLLDVWERFAREHGSKATLVFVGGNANRPAVAAKERSVYEQFAVNFDQKLAKLPQSADVRLIEHVTSGVENYYRAADVFAFPSLHEGLPNAVLEAMASGLPVVVNHFLGFPNEGGEFGFDGQHFINPNHDLGSWCTALASLTNEAARRARMGAAARRWMESFQDLDKITAQSAEFFHGLARKLPQRPS